VTNPCKGCGNSISWQYWCIYMDLNSLMCNHCVFLGFLMWKLQLYCTYVFVYIWHIPHPTANLTHSASRECNVTKKIISKQKQITVNKILEQQKTPGYLISRIFIQPAEVANKSHHFYKVIQTNLRCACLHPPCSSSPSRHKHHYPSSSLEQMPLVEASLILQYMYLKFLTIKSILSHRKTTMQEEKWKHLVLIVYWFSVRVFLMQTGDSCNWQTPFPPHAT
jgi:hypothetical protein